MKKAKGSLRGYAFTISKDAPKAEKERLIRALEAALEEARRWL